MNEEDFARAEELLSDPDGEDCERFASWYGRTLLDAARALPVALHALKVAQHALVTTHNLRATDLDVDTFEGRLINAVPRGEIEWFIDHTADLAVVDAAVKAAEVV